MKKAAYLIGFCILVSLVVFLTRDFSEKRVAVLVPRGSAARERLAALEIRRYLSLRTGILADMIPADTIPDGYDACVIIGGKTGGPVPAIVKDAEIRSSLESLNPEEYLIRTVANKGFRHHLILGGDEAGTLYGAYRFIEATGVRFGIDGDILPDERCELDSLNVNETGKPLFAKRGLQPFHDFNVGPDWWNLHDYRSFLSQMAKLRLNFIGFHTYPSWNPAAGPEANVWIGLPEDVDEQGNVRSGYEAGVVTTRRGWEVKAFPTSQYASGAGLFFEGDDYGPDFMLECLDWPGTDSAAAAMFNRYGDFQRNVFENARRLGITSCVGTEIPLGIPASLASRLNSRGMRPDDPGVIRRLYEGTFLRLMRKMPVDTYWLWLPEIWLTSEPGCKGWEIATEKNVERDLVLIDSAARRVRPPFGFATGGWRLGTIRDPLSMDKRAPGSWAISSINTSVGRDPVEEAYGDISGRPKWAIGWAEDDGAAGAHCCTCWDLQLWVERMFRNSTEAHQYGCEGMMAIHWRTASIAPNLSALSQAGWKIERPADRAPSDSSRWGDPDSFWEEWGRSMFGGDAGAEAGRIMQKFDGGHLAINAMISDGCRTTDSAMDEYFSPLRSLERLRVRIRGAGSLDRFDYWLNTVRASRLRVRTWVLASRLDSLMSRATALQGSAEEARLFRDELLPLRISIARSYEEMIAAYVRAARTPGEVGTISSIESGNRRRIVHAHDSGLVRMLGAPLPDEASVRTAYSGEPRIFVSCANTEWRVGEPLEIRPFVLSVPACTGVQLYWRFLGERSFRNTPAAHRARQAYRVTLPTGTEGTLEYYIEATMEDGQKARYPATAPSVNQTVVVW